MFIRIVVVVKVSYSSLKGWPEQYLWEERESQHILYPMKWELEAFLTTSIFVFTHLSHLPYITSSPIVLMLLLLLLEVFFPKWWLYSHCQQTLQCIRHTSSFSMKLKPLFFTTKNEHKPFWSTNEFNEWWSIDHSLSVTHF